MDGAPLEFQGTRTRMCRHHQNPKQPALGKESVHDNDDGHGHGHDHDHDHDNDFPLFDTKVASRSWHSPRCEQRHNHKTNACPARPQGSDFGPLAHLDGQRREILESQGRIALHNLVTGTKLVDLPRKLHGN